MSNDQRRQQQYHLGRRRGQWTGYCGDEAGNANDPKALLGWVPFSSETRRSDEENGRWDDGLTDLWPVFQHPELITCITDPGTLGYDSAASAAWCICLPTIDTDFEYPANFTFMCTYYLTSIVNHIENSSISSIKPRKIGINQNIQINRVYNLSQLQDGQIGLPTI